MAALQDPPIALPQTGIGLLDMLLQGIRRDPFGGIGVSPLSSPALVRQMAQKLPALLRALELIKRSVLLSQGDPSTLLGTHNARAITQFIPPSYEGPLSGLTQMIFPRSPATQSLAHEGLHALYGPQTAAPPAQYAQTILERLVPDAFQRAKLLTRYKGDTAHAALEAMAENIAARQGEGLRTFTTSLGTKP